MTHVLPLRHLGVPILRPLVHYSRPVGNMTLRGGTWWRSKLLSSQIFMSGLINDKQW